MRIACIYSTEQYLSVEKPLETANIIPFGISYIITVLQNAGHEVELFVLTPATSLEELFGPYIRDKQPRLFCFTAVSTQFWMMEKAAIAVKNIDPEVFTVLGGHHASLNPDQCIECGAFDAICIGEGEAASLELAKQLEANLQPSQIPHLWIRQPESSEVEKNPTTVFNTELDELPFINRRIWDPWVSDLNHFPNILLDRGCPFKCTYCSNHAMAQLGTGKYVRFRSPENVSRELEYICEEYPNLKGVYLEVETFGANLKGILQDF